GLNALLGECSLATRERIEPRALRFEGFLGGRDTHESAQREARQLANAARQPEYLAGSDAALARFVSQAHLDAYLQGRRVVRSLLVQAYRDALAVDRVHPGKVLRDGARLVRLQLAGEMPDQIQIGERGHLRN